MLPELDEDWYGEDSVAYRQGEGNGIAALGIMLAIGIVFVFTVWILSFGGCGS